MKIHAIVVTHNRKTLLQACVEALRRQTRPLDRITVINNGSTDDTAAWLSGQADLTVITQQNLGSAGGQASGISAAFQAGADWIWCMDDDTIPYPNALERLLATPKVKSVETGFVYSRHHYADGRLPVNDPAVLSPDHWVSDVLVSRAIPVCQASFVALLVSRAAAEAAGLPIEEMFLSGEDYEYTRRIRSKGFQGYCVIDSVIEHRCVPPLVIDRRTWSPVKLQYGIRNRIYVKRMYEVGRMNVCRAVSKILVWEFLQLLRGRSSPSIFWWGIKGLFFSPQIKPVTMFRPGENGQAQGEKTNH